MHRRLHYETLSFAKCPYCHKLIIVMAEIDEVNRSGIGIIDQTFEEVSSFDKESQRNLMIVV